MDIGMKKWCASLRRTQSSTKTNKTDKVNRCRGVDGWMDETLPQSINQNNQLTTNEDTRDHAHALNPQVVVPNSVGVVLQDCALRV
jgi:hypothetical protein